MLGNRRWRKESPSFEAYSSETSKSIFGVGELRKAGMKLKLGGQPFQVLTILLERHGEVVTREELQKRLWPDTFVDADHNLNTSINKIREALGDSAENPRFEETLPRRGYRFIVPVNEIVEVQNDLSSAATRLGRSVSTSQLPGSLDSLAVLPLNNAATTVSGSVPAAGHEARASQRSKSWKMVVAAAVLLAAAPVAGVLYHRSHRAKPLTDKDTVVLADFVNSTGDAVFDGTLRQGMAVQLEQSPFWSVISEQRMQQTLRLMGRPADAKGESTWRRPGKSAGKNRECRRHRRFNCEPRNSICVGTARRKTAAVETS